MHSVLPFQAVDYSHPCIVDWCPLNETYQEQRDGIVELDDASRAMYVVTKAADCTRPALDASGYSHRVPETDIYDCHDYEQNPRRFALNHAELKDGRPFLTGSGTLPIATSLFRLRIRRHLVE